MITRTQTNRTEEEMKEQLIEALDKFLMEKPEEFAKLAAKGSISLGDNGQLEIDFDVYQQLLKK